MEEARRFLRYVIPGLIFFIEVSLYSIFSAQGEFIAVLKEWGKNIAFPISIFLASGGVGFFLGVAYHTLYWTKGFRSLVVTHVPLIKDCVERGWLKLQNREDGTDLAVESLSQSGAWRVVTAYWHERREASAKIKAADPRTDSLTDIMHGLGAAFMGSILAIGFWIYTHFKLTGESPSWFFYVLPIFISCVHFVNYRRVVKDFQSIVDIIMTDDMKDNYEENEAAIIIGLSHNDLSGKTKKERNTRNA